MSNGVLTSVSCMLQEKTKAAAVSAKRTEQLKLAKPTSARDGGAAAKAAALRAALPETEEGEKRMLLRLRRL